MTRIPITTTRFCRTRDSADGRNGESFRRLFVRRDLRNVAAPGVWNCRDTATKDRILTAHALHMAYPTDWDKATAGYAAVFQ